MAEQNVLQLHAALSWPELLFQHSSGCALEQWLCGQGAARAGKPVALLRSEKRTNSLQNQNQLKMLGTVQPCRSQSEPSLPLRLLFPQSAVCCSLSAAPRVCAGPEAAPSMEHMVCTPVCIDTFVPCACTFVCLSAVPNAALLHTISPKGISHKPCCSSSVYGWFPPDGRSKQPQIPTVTAALAEFPIAHSWCVYRHMCVFVYLYALACFCCTGNKGGGRFLCFLNRWRNLEDQKFQLTEFYILKIKYNLKKKKLSGCGRRSLIFAAALSHEFAFKCTGFFLFFSLFFPFFLSSKSSLTLAASALRAFRWTCFLR